MQQPTTEHTSIQGNDVIPRSPSLDSVLIVTLTGDLPIQDIVEVVLGFLPASRELINAACVCRAWRDVVNRHSCWTSIIEDRVFALSRRSTNLGLYLPGAELVHQWYTMALLEAPLLNNVSDVVKAAMEAVRFAKVPAEFDTADAYFDIVIAGTKKLKEIHKMNRKAEIKLVRVASLKTVACALPIGLVLFACCAAAGWGIGYGFANGSTSVRGEGYFVTMIAGTCGGLLSAVALAAINGLAHYAGFSYWKVRTCWRSLQRRCAFFATILGILVAMLAGNFGAAASRGGSRVALFAKLVAGPASLPLLLVALPALAPTWRKPHAVAKAVSILTITLAVVLSSVCAADGSLSECEGPAEGYITLAVVSALLLMSSAVLSLCDERRGLSMTLVQWFCFVGLCTSSAAAGWSIGGKLAQSHAAGSMVASASCLAAGLLCIAGMLVSHAVRATVKDIWNYSQSDIEVAFELIDPSSSAIVLSTAMLGGTLGAAHRLHDSSGLLSALMYISIAADCLIAAMVVTKAGTLSPKETCVNFAVVAGCILLFLSLCASGILPSFCPPSDDHNIIPLLVSAAILAAAAVPRFWRYILFEAVVAVIAALASAGAGLSIGDRLAAAGTGGAGIGFAAMGGGLAVFFGSALVFAVWSLCVHDHDRGYVDSLDGRLRWAPIILLDLVSVAMVAGICGASQHRSNLTQYVTTALVTASVGGVLVALKLLTTSFAYVSHTENYVLVANVIAGIEVVAVFFTSCYSYNVPPIGSKEDFIAPLVVSIVALLVGIAAAAFCRRR